MIDTNILTSYNQLNRLADRERLPVGVSAFLATKYACSEILPQGQACIHIST